MNSGKRVLKRIIDIVISSIGLVLLLPLFLVISILILCCMGLPIFFVQERPGFREKPFRIIKFRTMSNRCDTKGNLLPNTLRKTKLGCFLRKLSLDELPELVNVLKGEMSLVGPRPLLISYLPLYNDNQRRRHDVKPGITGLAQINGRNALSWEQKFQYDLFYIDNFSIWMDMKILFLTGIKTLKRENITPENSDFTVPFNGSN